ncbi:MAG: 50S ribosomal protein L28 [Anaerolineales bacterium]|nr:50S ribosomal protein L28 [Anaerolineales bacterium]
MAKCEICGKGPQFGHNVSHSKRATRRRYDPNVQRMQVMVAGQLRRIYICTRCLRTLRRSS